jgi:hypothetical protein
MRGLKQPEPVVPHSATHVVPVNGSVSFGENSRVGVDHGPDKLDAVDTPKPHQGLADRHTNPQAYSVPYR